MAAASENEFTLRREFDAPRELVFDCWRDPAKLVKWFGPRVMSNRFEGEVREGAEFRLTMLDPGGTGYPIRGRFLEVAPPERLVYRQSLEEHPDSWHDLVTPGRDRSKPPPGHEAVVTVTFESRGARTLLTVHMKFEEARLLARHVELGMGEGWRQAFERMDELLAGEADRLLVATRLFDAPRELVWEAFSNPTHLARWWGPAGFTNTIHEFEFRAGGRWRVVMHGPDGTDFDNECRFVELVRPERVVLDHVSFPHFRLTFRFDLEGAKTRVTMRQLFDTAETCRKVRAYAEPANPQNLERLEGVVRALSAESR